MNWKVLIAIFLILLGFISYGNVTDYNIAIQQKPMQNFWEFWKPNFFGVSELNYVLFLPYTLIMFLWIRFGSIKEIAIILLSSIAVSLVFARVGHREMIFMFILISTGKIIENYYNRFTLAEYSDDIY